MFGIIANVINDKALRTGAKVRLYHCWSGARADMVMVNGLNKSGRRIFKQVSFKRLENFRATFVPDVEMQDPCYKPLWWHEKHDAQETAGKLCLIWAGLRHFSRYGDSITRDGDPMRLAYARAVSLDAGFQSYVVPMTMMCHHQRRGCGSVKVVI